MALANGLTPKQDAFAMAYVESGNAAEAYRRAYNAERQKESTIYPNASRLLSNSKVLARVKELHEMSQERHLITKDRITQMLIEDREFAREQASASAAVTASMGLAKVHGLITDKAEIAGKDGAPSITMTITRSVKTEVRG